ncbi:MAG: AAA family ATPase [Chloroflexi bacterium]|nr:AAA family ATPase [Chloroflexota bacterium]
MEYEGGHLDIPQRESLLRLLVRLLLDIDHPLARKTLAFSLWPDSSESDALANLRRHLHLIRNILPQEMRELLVISPRTITWKSSPLVWLDVREFEHAGNDLTGMEKAAALYRGDLAHGLGANDFILARREDLRNQHHAILKKLAQLLKEHGGHERGLMWIRKLSALEPWDEEVIRLQMTLEVLAGQRPAAIATYQALIKSLRDELGTLPLPETMALYTDILNNRLLQEPPSHELTEAAAAFISRQTELGQMKTILSELSNGHGRIVFISGKAGVGKTHFLQETLRRFLEPATGRLFWGNCQPDEQEVGSLPYSPWRKILSAAAPILAHSSELPLEWLNWLLPLVPDLLVLRSGLSAPSQPNAGELRAALRQIFHFLTIQSPLVLVVEDLHWADDASLELLAELGETCYSLPLLLLVTHRNDEQAQHLLEIKNSLRRQRCSHEINLQPFTPVETRLFIEHSMGAQSTDAKLIEEISAYAQGLPLLLREATDSLLEAHHLQAAGHTPPSLRASLRFRLEQLEDETRQLLESAAVLGFSFLQSELQAMQNTAPSSFAAALDKLLARKFLLDARSTSADDYAFSHQLIYQIILDEISAAHAAALHAQAGFALEKIHEERKGYSIRIALHYEKGGVPLKAAHHWLLHAQEVADISAFEQALELTDHAAALINGSSLEARQLLAQAALQRVRIAHYRGESEEALSLFEPALTLCREFPSIYYKALSEYANMLYARDRWPEGYQVASQAATLAHASRDHEAEAQALNWRALCNMMMGNTNEAVSDLEIARSRLEEIQKTNSTLYMQSLNHLGTALVFVQQYARAVEMLEKTVAQARAAGLKRLQGAALTMMGQVALNRGQYNESIRIYSESIETVGGSYVPGLWSKYAGRGAAYLRSGNIAEAREDFLQGHHTSSQVGSVYGQTLMQTYQWMAALAYLNFEMPAVPLAEIESKAVQLKIQPIIYTTSAMRAQIWHVLGQTDSAMAACDDSLRAAQATQVPAFILDAQVRHLNQRIRIAPTTDLWDELHCLTDKARAADEIPLLIKALLAKGNLLLENQRPMEALPIARECLALAQACPDQPLIAESFLLLAGAELQMGNHVSAETALIQSRSLAEHHYWLLLIQVAELENQMYGKIVTPVEEYRQKLIGVIGGQS